MLIHKKNTKSSQGPFHNKAIQEIIQRQKDLQISKQQYEKPKFPNRLSNLI